ncbi:helix-turn-helix domain-containing protein [Bradyrhizobium genosp. SA-3]|nr:helix-turn-helix domain-containing protein [Bradyrhizobium genosp. SA-3]
MLGITKYAAYEAAKRGEIPTIKIGRLLKVPKAAFDKMLEQAGVR